MDRNMMVDPNQRYVQYVYPEHWPNEPFVLVYEPCLCGHEVTVIPVTVRSCLARRLEDVRDPMYQLAHEALAYHIAENYQQRPGIGNLQRDHQEHQNVEVKDVVDHNGNLLHQPEENFPRLPDGWLVYPEYDPDDEPIKIARRNRRKQNKRKKNKIPDSESDEAEF